MGRAHTAKDALRLAHAFRHRFPDGTLATDVIVGFPGEGDSEHAATMRLLRDLNANIVNVTRFSPRQGTPAERMGGAPDGRVVKSRSRELSHLRMGVALVDNEGFVGTAVRALTTECGKPGTTLARTSGYRQIVLRGDLPLGVWHTTKILRANSINLFGCIMS
jgi:tRNA A37 methylthiotransferase MiaB